MLGNKVGTKTWCLEKGMKKKMNECHWKSILKSVTHVDIGNFWFAFVTALKCACISCSVLSYLDNSTTMGAETHVNHREIRYFSVNIHVHNCSQIFYICPLLFCGVKQEIQYNVRPLISLKRHFIGNTNRALLLFVYPWLNKWARRSHDSSSTLHLMTNDR